MAALMFIGAMICLIFGGTEYALVFAVCCVAWSLDAIREVLKDKRKKEESPRPYPNEDW